MQMDVRGSCVRLGNNVMAGDMLLPSLLLKQSALDHNIERMARYCEENGVSLAPHAKTTMAPGIIKRQTAAGVWGFTAANVVQAQKLRELDIARILIANEVVEALAIEWLAREISADNRFEAFVLVDSVRGVSILDSALARHRPARPLGVLLELGETGKRAGCRTDGEALRVAEAVIASKNLFLAGLEGFEAVLPTEPLRRYLGRMRALATRMAHERYFDRRTEVIVSVGSSEHMEATIDALADWQLAPPVRKVLRPGGYATNSIRPGYLPSLEIWGAVLSRPEPNLAIASFGRRDVPSDDTLPSPILAFSRGQLQDISGRAKIQRLYDQHAVIELTDTELQIGELVGCSVVSPFRPAFATWRNVPVVNDRYSVVEILDVLY